MGFGDLSENQGLGLELEKSTMQLVILSLKIILECCLGVGAIIPMYIKTFFMISYLCYKAFKKGK
jgi:hypothetical protein